MPIASLRKLWLVFATATVAFAINFVGITQGWPFSVGMGLFTDVKLKEMTASEAAVLGLAATLILFCFATKLALTHAERSSGSAASRFPFRLMDTRPDTRDGRVIQRFAVALFFAWPFWAIGHFWRYVWSAPLCYGAGGFKLGPHKFWEWIKLAPNEVRLWGLWDNRFRLAEGTCEHTGFTFEPVVQPLLAAILTILTIYLSAKLLLVLKSSRLRELS